MSASLVGSEMCIRDRAVAPGDARWSTSRRNFLTEGPVGGGGKRPTATCLPVSYTHLTLPTICSV
eukprot:12705649-Alexandrium_andersonii.AAC.1